MRKKEFSRREREVMDIVFRLGEATVSQVRAEMADPPSYSAVRSTLSILESKRHLRHDFDGNRYTYRPTQDRRKARKSALDHLLDTFFDASPAQVVSAVLEDRADELSREDLDRLAAMIEQAKERGR